VVSNYTTRPLAQFDDETVNLVATSDGVQGQVPDSNTFRLGVANAPTGPLRVIRVGLAGPRRLPVYPDERTFSG